MTKGARLEDEKLSNVTPDPAEVARERNRRAAELERQRARAERRGDAVMEGPRGSNRPDLSPTDEYFREVAARLQQNHPDDSLRIMAGRFYVETGVKVTTYQLSKMLAMKPAFCIEDDEAATAAMNLMVQAMSGLDSIGRSRVLGWFVLRYKSELRRVLQETGFQV